MNTQPNEDPLADGLWDQNLSHHLLIGGAPGCRLKPSQSRTRDVPRIPDEYLEYQSGMRRE